MAERLDVKQEAGWTKKVQGTAKGEGGDGPPQAFHIEMLNY